MPTIADRLSDTLRLGRPQHAGALTVFPIFGPEPAAEYLSFAQAQAAGLTIGELPLGASVNDLVVVNRTYLPVLLFDGEEVLGAQQNRTFDVSVLVAAGAELQVPVSCVEAGRWDGGRHTEGFRAAPQVAYPALRRGKNAVARARAAAGGEARADQGAVWNEIAAKSERMGAASPSGAMHDVFESRRPMLDDITAAIARQDGQLGALVAVGGACEVMDMVSRPDVWAALHRPLVQGYALAALEAAPTAAPEPAVAAAFLGAAIGTPVTERAGIGCGVNVDVANSLLAGSGLALEDELLQLSVFAGATPRARIRRPSERR
jgi:ARG/rhodanese/phosphatase superfamily protein